MNISSSIHLPTYQSAAQPATARGNGDESAARDQPLPSVEKTTKGEAVSDRREQTKTSDNERSVDKAEVAKELRDREIITELKARDREVRAHEAAHAAVGGQYAGAPTYSFQHGPNGVSYAVGGEVSISTSPVSGNPEATLQKAQQIQRAALAPAEPSTQDRRVAAQATQMAQQARIDITQQLEAEQGSLQSNAISNEESDKDVENEPELTAPGNTPQPGTNDQTRPATQSSASELTGLAKPIADIPQLLVDAGVRDNNPSGGVINQRV
jgi:hypothetical protein